MKKETWEKIEKEFDGKFVDWNNPSQFTLYYEGTKRVNPDAIKSFFRQKLEEREKEILEEIVGKG